MVGPNESHDDDEREATRMSNFDDSTEIGHSLRSAPAEMESSEGYLLPVRKFWNSQVSVIVPHEGCRDHFALERTYLSYLRTSLAFSFLSVIIAQLLHLQHSSKPDLKLGYFVLGKPLASICVGAAIVLLCLGAWRFWRQQNAILRGKVWAGGWEVSLTAMIVLLVTITMFILLIIVDSRREHDDRL